MKNKIFLWKNGRLNVRRTAEVEMASFPTAAPTSVLPGPSFLSPCRSCPSLSPTRAADCCLMVGRVEALESAALWGQNSVTASPGLGSDSWGESPLFCYYLSSCLCVPRHFGLSLKSFRKSPDNFSHLLTRLLSSCLAFSLSVSNSRSWPTDSKFSQSFWV